MCPHTMWQMVGLGEGGTVCFVLLFKVFLGLEIFQDENWRKFTQFRNRLQENPLVPSGRPGPWSGMSRDPGSNCTPPWMAVDGRVSLSHHGQMC